MDCMEYCLCGRWLMSILLGHTTPGYMEDHTRRRPPYSSPLPPFSHTYTTKLAIITNRQTHRHTTVPLQAVYITYCTDPNLQHISPLHLQPPLPLQYKRTHTHTPTQHPLRIHKNSATKYFSCCYHISLLFRLVSNAFRIFFSPLSGSDYVYFTAQIFS